jgi:hypothetical protein
MLEVTGIECTEKNGRVSQQGLQVRKVHGIEVLSAQILLTRGPDKILFKTTLPSGMPAVTRYNAFAEIEAAYDSGEEYVKTHFPGLTYSLVSCR